MNESSLEKTSDPHLQDQEYAAEDFQFTFEEETEKDKVEQQKQSSSRDLMDIESYQQIFASKQNDHFQGGAEPKLQSEDFSRPPRESQEFDIYDPSVDEVLNTEQNSKQLQRLVDQVSEMPGTQGNRQLQSRAYQKPVKSVKLNLHEKRRLSGKIHELLSRRSQRSSATNVQILGLTSGKVSSTSGRAESLIGRAIAEYSGQPEYVQKRKRSVISRELLEKMKILFENYDQALQKPHYQRITFRDIAGRVGISLSLVTNLYDEYTKDPLFINRINKAEQMNKIYDGSSHHNLTDLRIKFMKDLLRQNGPLTQIEIAKEMNKVDSLLQKDRYGKSMKIGRKAVHHLMKVGGLASKRAMQITPRNLNDPQFILNRFKYVKRYLQLTEDKSSDICFMGEFSFANSLSLSSCPPVKRDEFVDGRGGNFTTVSVKGAKTAVDDPSRTKVQYLMVLSLQGMVYYQIFGNIFRDINFAETLENIGNAMNKRNPEQKKYLILETCFLHRKVDLQVFEKKFPVKVIFLPPQTPMLNPTEYFFNEVKTTLKSRLYKTKQSYLDLLRHILNSYREKSMHSYYACIAPYVELALRQMPFK